jgi:hypothetical protein
MSEGQAMTRFPVVHEGGSLRLLACTLPAWVSTAPTFASRFAVLPRDQWQPFSIRHASGPILDQGSTSACSWFATCQAFWHAWRLTGQPVPSGGFSPTAGYARYNGGQDKGGAIQDALATLEAFGCCLADDVPNMAILLSQIPPEAWERARGYRCRGLALNSLEELFAAATTGHPVVFGTNVGRNFGQLDSEGVCPLPDSVLGGHALCADEARYSTRLGEWVLHGPNSWGRRWGNEGRFGVRASAVDLRYGAFVVLADWDGPGEQTDPPEVTG